MPQFNCTRCCCSPAIVLHPPKGGLLVCSNCGSAMDRQPLFKPIPLAVFLIVSITLVGISIPALLEPKSSVKPSALEEIL